jgi:transcriptional regulator with XRE-family HTH domain
MFDKKVKAMVSSDKKVYAVKSKFFNLLKKKELSEMREIRDSEIMEATGLSRNTIKAWKSQEPLQTIHVHSALTLAEFIGCEWHELCEPVELNEN